MEQPGGWRILAATDGSDGAEASFRFAASLLPRGSATVRVLTVFPYGSEPHSASLVEPEDPRHADAVRRIEAAVDETVRGARDVFEDAGHRVQVDHRFGNPADEIIAVVEEWHPDLVVVGRGGKRGPARLFLGSVSDSVLRGTHVRVLVGQ